MNGPVPDYAPLCAPPDRKPRAPRTAFPPLACDTHAHIFEARFPYAKERIYTPPDSNLADYKHLLKTLGCERAVLVQPSVYGADNAAMLDALRERRPGLPRRRGDRSGHFRQRTRRAAPRRRARPALQRRGRARQQEPGSRRHAAQRRQAHRRARLAHRDAGQSRRGRRFRAAARDRSACRWCSAISAIRRAAPRPGPAPARLPICCGCSTAASAGSS